MAVKRTVLSVLSETVIFGVPLVALLVFTPAMLETRADDALVMDTATVENALLLADENGEEFEEVTLENWDYTALNHHRFGQRFRLRGRALVCRILTRLGHPLASKFCSPILPDDNGE